MNAKDVIHQQVTSHPVVLYMKGTPQFPQCGFSANAVRVLQACGLKEYFAVNVLFFDAAMHEAIKAYADWPTFPQLYIRGQLVGGSDIMRDMYESGELQRLLAEG